MKGQTTMEYLMTYGWAILIIIVVIASLYSMGVFQFKGQRYSSEQMIEICQDVCLTAGMEYKDWDYDSCRCYFVDECFDHEYKGFVDTFCKEGTIDLVMQEKGD